MGTDCLSHERQELKPVSPSLSQDISVRRPQKDMVSWRGLNNQKADEEGRKKLETFGRNARYKDWQTNKGEIH